MFLLYFVEVDRRLFWLLVLSCLFRVLLYFVGGLFSSRKMWSFPSKDNTTLDDCNNARNGVYRNFPDTKNMPREFQRNEGAIIVARPVNNLISMQECYFQNGDFYTRVEWGTGLWSSWIKH